MPIETTGGEGGNVLSYALSLALTHAALTVSQTCLLTLVRTLHG